MLTKGLVHLPLSLNDNIEHWRDQSVFWQCFAHRVSLYLWVWMTTLNSEEITLCSDSVSGGSPPAYESGWQHWTVKRSLCALTVLTGGSICLWVWMTTLNSEEITLCSDSVDWGVVLCLWVWMTTLNIGEINLCSDSVLHIGCPLPLSLNENIEQWRDHSMLWQCFARGSICLSVSMARLNCEEITLCSDNVDQGGPPCLWVWMTTLNSEEITLCSDSVCT